MAKKANICGAQIQRLRIEKGMSQVDLAASLKVGHRLVMTQSDVSEIERGARGVRDFELVAFAKELGVSVLELVEEIGAQ